MLTPQQKAKILNDPRFKSLLIKKPVEQPKQPGYLDRLGNTYKGLGNELTQGITGAANDIQNGDVIEGVSRSMVRPVATAVRGIFAPLTEALSPLMQSAINKISDNKTVQRIADNGAVSSFLDHIGQWQQANPEKAQDIKDVFDIVTAFAGAKGAKTAGGAIGDVAGKAKTSAESGLSKANTFIDKTIKSGKEAIENVVDSDMVTPIEEGVKTELSKSSKSELMKYVDIAKQGAADYSKPSALDVVGIEAQKALKQLKKIQNTAGSTKNKIVTQLKDVHTGNLVYNSRKYLRQLMKDRIGAAFSKKGDIVNFPERVLKIGQQDKQIILDIERSLRGISTNPTFQKVDDVIGKIQSTLYKGEKNFVLPADTNVIAIGKEIIKDLNDNLKSFGGDMYKVPKENYSNLKKLTSDMNKMLGKDGKNAGALMKRIFSPSDAGTKKMFSKIKELTGIDLVKESTLAKYAMEKIGDARSASLLEQLNLIKPKGAMGWIETAAKKLIEKNKDPIRKAIKYTK